MAAPKLSHTIQTTVGMIIDNGAPLHRSFEDGRRSSYNRRINDSLICLVEGAAPVWTSERATYDFFTTCVLEFRVPNFVEHHRNWEVRRLRWNILACRDSDLDISFMKRNIASLKRLDLEQAAAVVLSAILKDTTIPEREQLIRFLIKGIDHSMLVQSYMWIPPVDPVETADSKFTRLVLLANRIFSKHEIKPIESTEWVSLLPALLRVRRCRPSNNTRCLFIPLWIFDAANVDPPSAYAIWDAHGQAARGYEPISAPGSDAIILSKKAFRSLQRKLLSYHQFWKPSIDLRKAIRDLEADVVYGASAIKRQVLPSTDTLEVAQFFIAIQRRLQCKIVSNLSGGFLGKGESGRFIQNTPHVPTSFEVTLGKFSRKSGISIAGAVLPQIDQCCLLMERYVLIYGHGDRTSLVFRHGVRGGSGRGPVDEYNLLCDILAGLRKKAQKEGKPAPGRVRKFLAKDIMQWNNGWQDDAFADGFVPGWEPWLKVRRERGVLLSEWEVFDGADAMDVDGEVSLPIR